MRIAVRVDASGIIGTGHFMRCLTLADALQQRGARICFASRHLPEYLRGMLAEKGHEFVLLGNGIAEGEGDSLSHAHWLGTSQRADAQDTILALSGQSWDWLVVDNYGLDASWESALRQTAKSILVIDDIADRQHDCDFLLDPNFYADMAARYAGKVPSHCQLLLGPRYALLRDEFRQLCSKVKPRMGEVNRAMVMFGGVDRINHTARAVDALAGISSERLQVDVVVGEQHPHREQIESACVAHNFTCHVQTNQIAALMAAADFAIGAGGSATWERCCLGLPTLTICAADNQKKQIADAAASGLLYAPELRGDLVNAIKRHVSALVENSHLRQAISRNGMQAVDGLGVSRVVGSMGCSGIEVRLAEAGDAEKLFEWRNHPTVRSVSRTSDIINWEDHRKWFASVLTASDRVLLIGQREGVPVGVVRFDVQGEAVEVSIYLVPGVGRSLQGRDLLQSAERWLSANRPEISRIRAHVLGCNERSQRLFTGAGYQVEATDYWKRIH